MSTFDTANLVSKNCTLSAAVALDKRVVVHPIVLLSVVDHYNRVAKGTNKRVVGCLLGETIHHGRGPSTSSSPVSSSLSTASSSSSSQSSTSSPTSGSSGSSHAPSSSTSSQGASSSQGSASSGSPPRSSSPGSSSDTASPSGATHHHNNVNAPNRGPARGASSSFLSGRGVTTEIHASSSFAVPFEEDSKDSSVWFLDHNYLEKVFRMFKKVNAKEKVIGWYSTGPKIRPADLEVHEVIRRYCPNPIYLIVDIDPKHMVVPTDCYFSFEEATSDKTFRRTFVHIPSTIGAPADGAYEAEEVGVEHLLRDLKNASTSTLATRVADKQNSLKNLVRKLGEISEYLDDVVDGRLPKNFKILYNLQDTFNLLPDIEENPVLVKAFAEQTNDQMLAIYLASVVRSVIALHDLINNKLEDKNVEMNEATKDVSKKGEGKKEEAEGEKAKNCSSSEKSGTEGSGKKSSSS